jgi:regulator of protease activity HflC (stomatin/prohibitin superfamily)
VTEKRVELVASIGMEQEEKRRAASKARQAKLLEDASREGRQLRQEAWDMLKEISPLRRTLG